MFRNTFSPSSRFYRTVRTLAGVALAASVVGCVNAVEQQSATDAEPAQVAANQTHTTSRFQGVKANTGYATHSVVDGKQVLSVSDDFQIPNTPAPHWQVVDSSGNVYLLNQFKIKDNKANRTTTLPAYVKDVAKVQVWCSYAEALLGEASFATPVQ